MTAVVTACPYCRAAATGRFCSECGKSLDVAGREGAVTRELLGWKLPDYRSLAHTAWLAVAEPHTLSRRWSAGDRHRLTSPVAMLAFVGALASAAAVIATSLTGNHAPGQADTAALGNVLDATPFLRGWFPVAAAEAARNPAGFADRLRQVGSWLAAAWPALFLVPGFLTLAPWRRIARHDALIIACVETLTIMALAGVYSMLRIAAPSIASNLMVTTGIWLLLCVHTTRHIARFVPGTSLAYAATRPIIATLIFPVVVYAWMVGVIGLTLFLTPALTA